MQLYSPAAQVVKNKTTIIIISQSINQWFYFGNKPISEIDNKTGETEETTKTTKTVKNITHTLHTQMQIRKSA